MPKGSSTVWRRTRIVAVLLPYPTAHASRRRALHRPSGSPPDCRPAQPGHLNGHANRAMSPARIGVVPSYCRRQLMTSITRRLFLSLVAALAPDAAIAHHGWGGSDTAKSFPLT